MKSFRLGSFVLQLYYPTIIVKLTVLQLTFSTAIGITKNAIGVQIFGFGLGLGYVPVSIHDAE